jgi:hypothetical protein
MDERYFSDSARRSCSCLLRVCHGISRSKKINRWVVIEKDMYKIVCRSGMTVWEQRRNFSCIRRMILTLLQF